jgi:hypothetical protein
VLGDAEKPVWRFTLMSGNDPPIAGINLHAG